MRGHTGAQRDRQTNRQTERRTERRSGARSETDAICNTKPRGARLADDDCHAHNGPVSRRYQRQHQDFKLLLVAGFLLQYRRSTAGPTDFVRPQSPPRMGPKSGEPKLRPPGRTGAYTARGTKMIADGTLMTDVDSPRSIRAANKYRTNRLPYRRELCTPRGRGGCYTTQ